MYEFALAVVVNSQHLPPGGAILERVPFDRVDICARRCCGDDVGVAVGGGGFCGDECREQELMSRLLFAV